MQIHDQPVACAAAIMFIEETEIELGRCITNKIAQAVRSKPIPDILREQKKTPLVQQTITE